MKPIPGRGAEEAERVRERRLEGDMPVLVGLGLVAVVALVLGLGWVVNGTVRLAGTAHWVPGDGSLRRVVGAAALVGLLGSLAGLAGRAALGWRRRRRWWAHWPAYWALEQQPPAALPALAGLVRDAGVPFLPEATEAYRERVWEGAAATGAADAFEQVFTRHPELRLQPPFCNLVVNMLISAGLYREACAVAERVTPAALTGPASGPTRDGRQLVEINRAEAEYNLGEWAAAEARLLPDDGRWDAERVVVAGRRIQLAWIAAHTGRPEAALAWYEGVTPADLPEDYVTEFHYPKAAALAALGRWEEAEVAVRDGLAVARRPASARNGQFLLARIEAGRGRIAEAEGLARTGAAHAWRGQGGDGLLLWGDLLVRLGRSAEARRAWSMAVERDPQSESARTAAARLAAG